MKKIISTIIISLISYQISYQQNINTSKVYQKGLLKSKTKDTTQEQTAPVTYSSKNYTVLPVIKGKPNTYSYSTGKNALTKQQYLNSITSKNKSRQLKSTKNYETKTDSLKLIKTEKDNLGFTHSKYRQYHKGVKVDGAIIIVHEKDGQVTHINGNFYSGLNIDVEPKISPQKAFKQACKFMGVKSDPITNLNNIELIITPENGIYTLANFKLCYQVNLYDNKNNEGWEVFIGAKDGNLVNKRRLISTSSSIGTATTLYSGVQNITTEYNGSYYSLIDSTRNIFTYNGSNDSSFLKENIDLNVLASELRLNPENIVDIDNNWQPIFFLKSVSINNLSNWWHTFLSDETPDIYIAIKDGSNNLVYLSSYASNTNPTIAILNINIILNNPPYSLEIWDYDAVNDDDFGGTYTIPLVDGDNYFSNYGNSGYIEVATIGNLAADVHWGLSQTYDFYLSEFSRKSFDNNGANIISFINPIGQDPNNAGAADPPLDLMIYGLGDGEEYSPFVALDITAHEFTHMINNYTADLIYQGESGAIDESFADIFGTMVEFYSDSLTANWLIGEDLVLYYPYYMRSMLNPNSTNHPDTYVGDYWINPSDSRDHGGVHTNNGVMNYWFYLLSEGGAGTNDNSNSYSVNGVGRNKAMKIAFRTLSVYLWESSEFLDVCYSSLQAAEDLYGSNSTEWWEVKRAWYAVGVINTDPDKFCDGTVEISETSGTITDGSGGTDYAPNSSCKWLIKPVGATSITIDFTSFNIELDYDSVIVYSSINDDMAAAQLIWSGNTLPPQVNIPGGAALVEFISDGSIQSAGWELAYSSTTVSTCHGYDILSDTTGTITDNSGTADYGNNQTCIWVIAPPGAQIIGLDVTMLDTEQDYDGLMVFDGEPDFENFTNRLGAFTGNTIPSTVYAYSGEMWVLFMSDPFITGDGFSADYFSYTEPYCEGTVTYTADYGFIQDGSGDSNYYHNSNCSWLIQPQDAHSIRLEFTEFELEEAEEDGKSYYDYVSIYDGSDESAPLLGKYAGNNIPNSITSTGSSMFIKFSSDLRKELDGFSAFYQTITPVYCNSNNTFTSTNDTISDGSGTGQYGNNSDCQYLIQPPNADSIILSFTYFSTEKDFDGVIIYDGSDTTGTKLATLTGDTIPNPIVAESGSMFIWFLSDETVKGEG